MIRTSRMPFLAYMGPQIPENSARSPNQDGLIRARIGLPVAFSACERNRLG